MVQFITRELIAEQAIIHTTPVLRTATTVDRSFELPTGLYAATAALFLGFIAVMAIGFGNPELVVPMAIFVTFIAMFFAVPAAWVRMNPVNAQRAIPWARFQRDGIMTAYGRMTAGAATVQVLIMPALIFAWGITVVTIAALVR